ncbi:MFS transporter [Streptomyces sp. NPDC056304]|uniref:MFS transporter n=1 Tax=Streptomyces sp. NPDC056304 TaxID=3345778 RepID=UPI0035D7FC9F
MPGGGVNAVGVVMAARILAVLVVLLLGGVFTDRLGARAVMLTADLLRFTAQGTLAVLLLTHSARVWEVVALAVVLGVGEGGFSPGLTALVPGLVPADDLADANSLLQITQAVTSVAGPGLAGLLIAAADAGTVVAVDAVSYGMSFLALAGLPLSQSAAPHRGLFTDLGRGWKEFTSRTWLWVTTLQISLFNFVLWAPFLVLGADSCPAAARRREGLGAGSGPVRCRLNLRRLGAARQEPQPGTRLVHGRIRGLGHTGSSVGGAVAAGLGGRGRTPRRGWCSGV